MSQNNVRGPTSALTEFLRASGITPSTIARRAATQNQPVAGPSNANGNGNEEENDSNAPTRRGRRTSAEMAGYASDELDEPESPPKKSKTAEAKKGKGKATKAQKNKAKKEETDEDEDAYTALSKSMWSNAGPFNPRPANGSFAKCAKCEKQFTVTKYTIAANDGSGFLCHSCAKSSGTDPFKKAVPRKRKAPVDKRKVTYFEDKRFPSLANVCIDIISDYIDDIEAFGNIGAVNMTAISKALAKNRRLTHENAHLFYGAENNALTFYDATKFSPSAMVTLGQLNPNITSLRLDFCGQMSDDVLEGWKISLPNLTSLELFGPFLVRSPAWISFLETHKPLNDFMITQSPRFNLECLKALLVSSADSLTRLRLREIDLMCDEFLEEIASCTSINHLDISEPSKSCSDKALIDLLSHIGPTLTYLDVSHHQLLTDVFLEEGLGEHTNHIQELVIAYLPQITDKGLSKFFSEWNNEPLLKVDMSRNPELKSDSLLSVLEHSGRALQVLDINGLKDIEQDALDKIPKKARHLKSVNLGWCRAVDDFIMKDMLEQCSGLAEIKCWGCNKVEGKWVVLGTRSSARIYGIEAATG